MWQKMDKDATIGVPISSVTARKYLWTTEAIPFLINSPMIMLSAETDIEETEQWKDTYCVML